MYKVLAGILIVYLLFLLCVKYQLVGNGNYTIYAPTLYVLVVSIFVFSWNKKPVWFFAIPFFLYALYNLFIVDLYAAEPGYFEFTQPLMKLLYRDSRDAFEYKLIGTVPDLLYLAALISFLTGSVRRRYKVSLME